MFQKTSILLLYALLVFFLLRSIDWYYSVISVAVPTVLDPNKLNVRKLKSILNYRGILDDSVIEKKELVEIAAASGQITDYDIQTAEAQAQDDNTVFDNGNSASSTGAESSAVRNNGEYSLAQNWSPDWERFAVQRFTGAAHFYELVEDCKDSAWLVRVDVEGSYPALSDSIWRKAFMKLGRFGIRFGVLDCSADLRMCEDRHWNSSRVLLALPYANQAKSSVVLQTYVHNTAMPVVHSYSATRPLSDANELRYVVSKWGHLERWFYKKMSSKVLCFTNSTSLSVWLNGCASDVCLLLVSSLTLPPVLLSALSVRFTGRVRFGMVSADVVNQVLKSSSDGDDEEPNDRSLGEPPEEPSTSTVTSQSHQSPDPGEGAGKGEARLTGSGLTGTGYRNGQYLLFWPSLSVKLKQFLNLSSTSATSRSHRWAARLTVYNERPFSDRVSFARMHRWLRWVMPDLNDVFVFSLALVNIFATMSVFDYFPPLQRMIPAELDSTGPSCLLPLVVPMLKLALTFLKYNLMFLFLWLLVMMLSRVGWSVELGRLGLAALRHFSLSQFGRAAVRDFEQLGKYASLLVSASFIVFTGFLMHLRNRYFKTNRRTDRIAESPDFGPLGEQFSLQAQLAFAAAENRRIRLRRIRQIRQRPSLFEWLASPSQPGDVGSQQAARGGDAAQFSLARFRAWNGLHLADANSDDGELLSDSGFRTPAELGGENDSDSGSSITVDSDSSAENNEGSTLAFADARIMALVRELQTQMPGFKYRRPTGGYSYRYILDLPVWRHQSTSTANPPGDEAPSTDFSCGICLEAYAEGQDLCALPCAHAYHKRCIFSWLFRDQRNCPSCREQSDRPPVKKNLNKS